MIYTKCDENEATHVRILDTIDNQESINFLNITIGEVYEIHKNDESGLEGEEMIKNDEGFYICSFSLILDVDWIK